MTIEQQGINFAVLNAGIELQKDAEDKAEAEKLRRNLADGVGN